MAKKFLTSLKNIPEYLLIVMVAVMVILENAEIIHRGIFNRSVMDGIDEALRICLVWIGMLGAAVAVKRNLHFSVTLLADKIRAVNYKMIQALIQISIIIFAIVLFVKSLQATKGAFAQTFWGLNIPVAWMYIAAPIASALMIIYCIIALIKIFKREKEE
jgi:TRAP-type C4-dicarboxylate transport system permease small subunit